MSTDGRLLLRSDRHAEICKGNEVPVTFRGRHVIHRNFAWHLLPTAIGQVRQVKGRESEWGYNQVRELAGICPASAHQ